MRKIYVMGAARWNDLSASRLSVGQHITRKSIDCGSSSDGGWGRHRDSITPHSQPLEDATLNRIERALIQSWCDGGLLCLHVPAAPTSKRLI